MLGKEDTIIFNRSHYHLHRKPQVIYKILEFIRVFSKDDEQRVNTQIKITFLSISILVRKLMLILKITLLKAIKIRENMGL